MTTTMIETLSLIVALVAILGVGSSHLRLNLWIFSIQVMFLTAITVYCGIQRSEPTLFWVAACIFSLKAVWVPRYLQSLIAKVKVERDRGTFIPPPLAMHLSIGFMAISYLIAIRLPAPAANPLGCQTAMAAISLVCTGLVLMLTRRIALSQIIGFLVLENGIYLFGLTRTHGMPMLVEMGIMLDVLAGVMIAGLIAFRINKNFEHIDVTMLSSLKE